MCKAANLVYATHQCAYQCFLSTFAGGGVAGESCWLSAKPSGAQGTQCPTFPASGVFGAIATTT